MDKYQETFETWNNLASLYEDKFMNLDLYNDSYDIFCRSIRKEQAKILDIGCGPGNITKYLLNQRPDFDILGIDIAPNMIELARKNNPTASFAIMDSRRIDEINTKFDGIVGGFCLPYLSKEESDKLIENSYYLLKDNGLIYLSFVEGDPQKSDFKVGSGGRVFFYYHNLEGIKEKLNKTNFVEIETFKLKYEKSESEFDIHTIMIAKKGMT